MTLRAFALAVLLTVGIAPAAAHEACDRDDLLRFPVGKLLLGVRNGVLRSKREPIVGPLEPTDVMTLPPGMPEAERARLLAAFEASREVLETATSLAAIDYQLTGRPFQHRTLDYYLRHARVPLADELPALVEFLHRDDRRTSETDALRSVIALVRGADGKGRWFAGIGGDAFPSNERVRELVLGSQRKGVERDHQLVAALHGLSTAFLTSRPLHEEATGLVERDAEAALVLAQRLRGAPPQILFDELMNTLRDCTRANDVHAEVERVLNLPEPFRSLQIAIRGTALMPLGLGNMAGGPYGELTAELPAAYRRLGLAAQAAAVERGLELLDLSPAASADQRKQAFLVLDETTRTAVREAVSPIEWPPIYDHLVQRRRACDHFARPRAETVHRSHVAPVRRGAGRARRGA